MVTDDDVVTADDDVTADDVITADDVVKADEVVSPDDVVTADEVVSADDVVTADDEGLESSLDNDAIDECCGGNDVTYCSSNAGDVTAGTPDVTLSAVVHDDMDVDVVAATASDDVTASSTDDAADVK